jgi:chlorophyll(ide) b reductase
MLRLVTLLSLCTATAAFAPAATSLPRPSALAAAAEGVVITGGAGGVGYAYAGEFLERGYNVVICDVQDCSAAVSSLKGRAQDGAQIFSTKCDVSSVADVEKLGKFAQDKMGTIGYWVNNAGRLCSHGTV